jgi:predicted regulator of Ras-like GTPase activity (Roadblock/LC7/MglB family)
MTNQSSKTGSPYEKLRTALEQARQAIGARQVMAADFSGNLLAIVPAGGEREAVLLGALGAGNLAAMDEMLRLSGTRPKQDDPQTLIVEGMTGCLVLCRGKQGLIFIAALDAEGVIGLARLEVRQLAKTVWKEVEPASDEPAVLAVDLAQKFLDSLDAEL